jgi:signal transduction histidine kinase
MSRRGQSPTSFLFSLRGRLFFLICLATLPALLFTFFVARNERAGALARTEQDALHLARLASREHAHQIRGARELLLWLGGKVAREGLGSSVVTDSSFLRAILAGHPQLANIGVLSPDGLPISSAYPLRHQRSWRDNPAYRAALRSQTVAPGAYVISPIFERPTLNLAYAVRDSAHRVIAVLFNGLDLGWFSQMARETDVPEGFSFYIIDAEGHVVVNGNPASTDRTAVGAHLFPDLPRVERTPNGRVLEADSAGVVRYVATAALEEMPGLLVAVSLPYDRVVADANTAFYRTLGGLSLLTLFNVVAVFIAAEVGILRRVRSLANEERRIGAVELSARAIPPRGHNEFSTLVTEFNTMAETVELRHREALDAQARLRALASRLQTARETEAARISRELHDQIGQLLTSLKIDLAQIRSAYREDDPIGAAVRERAAEMSRQIDAAVGFVRRLSAELRPGVLDRLGLVAALEWLASDLEKRTGLHVHVDASIDDTSLSEVMSVTLFRITQEALTNVVRHAEAHDVEISLGRSDGNIVLVVRDDGRGIAPDAAESAESLGIIGMLERTAAISGRLTVDGARGVGTTVTVTAPLIHEAEDDDAHPAC